jgi:hypothetical protein
MGPGTTVNDPLDPQSLRDAIDAQVSRTATGRAGSNPLLRTGAPPPEIPYDATLRYRMRYQVEQSFILPSRNPAWSTALQAEAAFIMDWCIYAEKTVPRTSCPADFPGSFAILNPAISTWGMRFGQHLRPDGDLVAGYLVERTANCAVVLWSRDEEALVAHLRKAWQARLGAHTSQVPFWKLMQAEALQRLLPPVIPAEAFVLGEIPQLIPDEGDTRRLSKSLVLEDGPPPA